MSSSNETLELSGPGLKMFFSDTAFYRVEHIPVESRTHVDGSAEHELRIEGSNTIGFLMVFDYPGALREAAFWGMIKTLMENPKALGKKEEDFAVLNLAENHIHDIKVAALSLDCKLCVIWGDAPQAPAVSYEMTVSSGVKMLRVDSADLVANDRELKNKLWAALQPHI